MVYPLCIYAAGQSVHRLREDGINRADEKFNGPRHVFVVEKKEKNFLSTIKQFVVFFFLFFLVSFLDTFLKGGNFLFNVYQTDFVTDSGNGERGIFKIIN